jgi:hypothetical protein
MHVPGLSRDIWDMASWEVGEQRCGFLSLESNCPRHVAAHGAAEARTLSAPASVMPRCRYRNLSKNRH